MRLKLRVSSVLLSVCMLLTSLVFVGNPTPVKAAAPVNPNSTQAVADVLNYISSIAADGKILSGQHLKESISNLYVTQSEYQHVYDLTGKYPAILGLDMDFRERTEFASIHENRMNKVNLAIEHWKNGGLVTFCWHQTNPAFPYDSGYDYVKDRNVTFTDVITPGTDVYNAWLGHIDMVAEYLKILRDEGVVVIWRPYHEMNISAFWWGNRWEEYKTLWRNMYDRYTNYHGLNNLIWVWGPNKGDMDWAYDKYYPGDQYVDITGADVYAGARDSADFQNSYDGLKAVVPGKPVALTEIGLPPDISILQSTDYSWFLIWHTTWCDNVYYGAPTVNKPGCDPATMQSLYADPMVITRDEVPNLRGTRVAGQYEAEGLEVWDSCRATVKSGTGFSAGEYSFIGDCVPQDYIEYTINLTSAATKTIYVGTSEGTARGKWQMSVNGTNVGTEFDAYNSTWKVTEMNMGTVALNAGENKIRFTVTGKNTSATSYNIGFDYIEIDTDLLEAEDLVVWDSCRATVKSGTGFRAGNYSFIGDCVLQDYIEYSIYLPGTVAKTMYIGTSEGTARGKWQMSVNGTNVGTEFDAYNSTWKVTELNMGSITLNPGVNKIRFTVTGKNASATSYNIGFDYIDLR